LLYADSCADAVSAGRERERRAETAALPAA
jgi:hypothetical protein